MAGAFRVKIYIDGAQVTLEPGALSNSTIGNATSSFFGRRNTDFNTYGDPLNGQLDEFGIWNRVLTDCEIIQLYNQTSTEIGRAHV